MKTAIILHGMPLKEEYYNPESESQSNKHWLPWIQKQLILHDILAQTPEMPKPYYPDYVKWSRTFEQFNIDKDTILIGHSCGGGFLVRWLSENKVEVDKITLVAPWLDPLEKKVLDNGMFDFEIDPSIVERVGDFTVFYDESDDDYIIESVKKIEKGIKGINLVKLQNMGHFTFSDMKTNEFPELVDYLIK